MIFLFINITPAVEIVEYVLLAIIALLVIFDIYLYLDDAPGNTISNILHKWVYKDWLFFISYLWGVLAGHFFLGTEKPPFGHTDSNQYSLVIVLGIALLLFLLGLYFKKRKSSAYHFFQKPYVQTILLIFGAVIGHFFWSLKFSAQL